MVAEQRGYQLTASAVASFSINFPGPPGPQSYVLLSINYSGIATASAVTGAGGGTFVLLVGRNSSGRRSELWLGYGFGTSRPITATLTRTGGSTCWCGARVVDVFADASVLPTFAGVSATGTSTAPDPGLITPAVGDIMLLGLAVSAATTPSARSNTGNTYLNQETNNASSTHEASAWCEAKSATPTTNTWTLAASTEWVATQARITPPAPPTPTQALLLKGLTTQAADAASSF